jgi:hypothetical protein
VAQDRDLLDQLARADPGELRRLDGPVVGRGERRQPCALGRDGGSLGRSVLGGSGPEPFDLRLDGDELRPQRLGGILRVAENALDVDAQPTQLLFELGQMLDRLFGRSIALPAAQWHRRRRRVRAGVAARDASAEVKRRSACANAGNSGWQRSPAKMLASRRRKVGSLIR